MELVITVGALALVVVLVLGFALARRSLAGRQMEAEVRADGELEPIVLTPRADRIPAGIAPQRRAA